MTLPTTFSLAGKTALITGAGRGIGTGIAEVFAEAGADVLVNALTETYLMPFVDALARRTGRKITGLAGDCTTPDGAAALAERARTHAPQIDILVNNLGDAIRGAFAPPGGAPVSDDAIRQTLDLNLMATIYCTREFAPAMLARRAGKIVNISSFGGLRGSAGLSLYAAAKAGLSGLTRSLALEWAPNNVQVNAIAPGIFPDPQAAASDQDRRWLAAVVQRVPLGRVGLLREVGYLALYLASPASDYMTGQVLALDGGMTV
jgi:NAD(P)-dependent dehydrogenase (short-subunit alcohol dehydrogenase family)